MTQPVTHGHDAEPVPQKSTLYCFDCDYADAIDGDWTRHVHGRAVEYACPACGTTIANRPRSTETSADRMHPETALGRVVRRSIDVWRASLDAGLRQASALTHQNRRNR